MDTAIKEQVILTHILVTGIIGQGFSYTCEPDPLCLCQSIDVSVKTKDMCVDRYIIVPHPLN